MAAGRGCAHRRAERPTAASQRGRCRFPFADTTSSWNPATSPRDFVFLRPLPTIGLVHDHDVVQQLLVDGRRHSGRIDFIRSNLITGAIINWQTCHGRPTLPCWSRE